MILFFVQYFWNLRHVKEEHARLFQAESEVNKKEINDFMEYKLLEFEAYKLQDDDL